MSPTHSPVRHSFQKPIHYGKSKRLRKSGKKQACLGFNSKSKLSKDKGYIYSSSSKVRYTICEIIK
jgi:hypothetical protein